MTDLQFEALLTQKAAALPCPARPLTLRTDAPMRRRPRLQTALAVAALLACLLAAGAYAYTELGGHGLWMSYYPGTADEAQRITRTEGYPLAVPDTLGGWPLRRISKASAAPHGTSQVDALLHPRYVYYTFAYGADGKPSPLPCTEDTLYYPDAVSFHLTVGSTDDSYWAYCFGYDTESRSFPLPDTDEEGLWQDLGTEEIAGCTVFLRRRVRHNGGGYLCADWLSPDGSLVLGITVFESGQTPELVPLVREFLEQTH